jgi:hypothetical protein
MSGAKPPLPQYAYMALCSVKAQGEENSHNILKGDCWGWTEEEPVTIAGASVEIQSWNLPN